MLERKQDISSLHAGNLGRFTDSDRVCEENIISGPVREAINRVSYVRSPRSQKKNKVFIFILTIAVCHPSESLLLMRPKIALRFGEKLRHFTTTLSSSIPAINAEVEEREWRFANQTLKGESLIHNGNVRIYCGYTRVARRVRFSAATSTVYQKQGTFVRV